MSPSPADLGESAQKEARAERVFNFLVVGAMALGFLTLVGVSITAVTVMARNLTYTDWVAHTYQVDTAIGVVVSGVDAHS